MMVVNLDTVPAIQRDRFFRMMTANSKASLRNMNCFSDQNQAFLTEFFWQIERFNASNNAEPTAA